VLLKLDFIDVDLSMYPSVSDVVYSKLGNQHPLPPPSQAGLEIPSNVMGGGDMKRGNAKGRKFKGCKEKDNCNLGLLGAGSLVH
jgi:hypothetical protein